MVIILPDCQNAREYEEAKTSEKIARVVSRRLGRDGRYAKYTKIDRNGSHRRNDPTAEKASPTDEPQIKIAHVRASIPGKRKSIYISLLPSFLLPNRRTPSKIVVLAVAKRAEGMSFRRIASAIGVVPRTVAHWLRRLERAKVHMARSHAKGSLAKAARQSMHKFFRALHRADVLVLAKLLADGIVI